MITNKTIIPYEVNSLCEGFSSIPLLLESIKMEKFKQISSNGEYAIAVSTEGKVYV
jgi:hypothetical protein